MTTDQLTPAHKAVADLVPGYFDTHGWGFGVSIVTRREDLPNVGIYGWDGGLGSVWRNDPRAGMVTILMTHQAWRSPEAPAVVRDVWALAYQAIDA